MVWSGVAGLWGWSWKYTRYSVYFWAERESALAKWAWRWQSYHLCSPPVASWPCTKAGVAIRDVSMRRHSLAVCVCSQGLDFSWSLLTWHWGWSVRDVSSWTGHSTVTGVSLWQTGSRSVGTEICVLDFLIILCQLVNLHFVREEKQTGCWFWSMRIACILWIKNTNRNRNKQLNWFLKGLLGFFFWHFTTM